tara:strand:- start:1117 stop:1809 length:693 start_codon:yes stop_codon:yes gene_type:complete
LELTTRNKNLLEASMANVSFEILKKQLQENFKKPLPGVLYHQAMQATSKSRLTAKPNAKTRKSAVLILFYPYKNHVFFPLILRPPYDGVHSGQIAFPGGRYEKTDEDLIRTALREAQEEIGLRLNDVEVLGILSELFIPPSNFNVLPVIATIPYRPDFFPDPREVEDIYEINLNEILDKNIIGSSEKIVRGESIFAPHYHLRGHFVWGATAMMISELLALINNDLSETIF